MSEYAWYIERTASGKSVKNQRLHKVRTQSGDFIFSQCGHSWELEDPERDLVEEYEEVQPFFLCGKCFSEEVK